MLRLLTTLMLLACLLVPSMASADGGSKLLIDACRDEKVDGTYTQKDYTSALNQLSTDADQYSACRSVIERARLAALAGGRRGGAGGGKGGGGAGGTASGGPGAAASTASTVDRANPLATATPEQRKALSAVGKTRATPVSVGGQLVTPGALGLGDLAGEGHDLPVPLIVLLGALALAVLGGGGRLMWSRVHARRLG